MTGTYVPFLRLTLSGAFVSAGTDHEIFSISSSWGGTAATAPTEAAIEAGMDTLATACETFWEDSPNGICSTAHLRQVKVAAIDAQGSYGIGVSGHVREMDQAAEGPPFGNSYRVSAVMHLGTGERGIARRGRMYVPAPAFPIGDTSLFTGTTVGTANAFWTSFWLTGGSGTIKAAMDGISGGAALVVASSKGYNTLVTNMEFNPVPATVRSRTNKLH